MIETRQKPKNKHATSTVKDSEDCKSEISKTASWPSWKRSMLVKCDKTQGQAEKHTGAS